MNHTGVRSTGWPRQAPSSRAAPPGRSGANSPPSSAAVKGAAQRKRTAPGAHGTMGCMASHDPTVLPPGLPVPVDDGAADHLPGQAVPALTLPSTAGEPVDLAAAAGGTLVLFCYPRTGPPGEDPPPGRDELPRARGCTPQARP